MDYVIIRESEAPIVKVFSFITIFVFVVTSFFISKFSIILGVLFFLIGLFLAGFSNAYRITKDFNNEKLFILYGRIFWRSKLDLEFPDYISVFHASFVSRDEVEGTEDKFKKWVVRFFSDNRFFTILEENDYHIALKSANELSELLGVEVYDRSKK
ncbi:hypothetical protein ATE84_0749 [Aquimarina sp. MAR_2010_214]|uniref:hypothetical protein n=1 Tax=Aquimarina sp. MAR_2010_214 TaxID=1250026 RepID=UPI000C705108|nr:hypothetical protein [Aquimarina sp. MAR_2010_214]PKV48741.1 hypothetical protein ATE84_0749 [Aquimarina sp. MAR_2010_214]